MANTDGQKEIKLNPPKTFDGSREKFRKFLQDAELYMTINKKLYDNDLVKIGFVLSFMTEGQAAAWADQFVEEAAKKTTVRGHNSIPFNLLYPWLSYSEDRQSRHPACSCQGTLSSDNSYSTNYYSDRFTSSSIRSVLPI